MADRAIVRRDGQPPGSVRRFAFLIAGPRDLAINAALNGFIAWLVFGAHDTVPLAGPGSIFVMLLPMVFIESAATTFFGCLVGTRWRRLGRVTPASAAEAPWVGRALATAFACGAVALAAAFAVRWMLARWLPAAAISPGQTAAGIALLSGVLAYGMHARAVLKASRFNGSVVGNGGAV